MKNQIVCIGQAVLDCITRGREKEPYKKNVFRADSITLAAGGDAVNESIHLARRGNPVRLVCGVGNDAAGRLLVDEVRRNGVDTGWITVSDRIRTPVASLMVNEDGSRSSVNSRATMLADYTPCAEVVKGAAVVSFASLFRAPLDQKETVVKLIRAAKSEGAVICADTKLPTYRQLTMKDLSEVLPLIDYIFPNENEAAYYTGETDYMAMAEHLRGLGIRNVIVKAGPEGCVACGEKERFHMKSYPVKAVDSSGAGDSFVAGFICALLAGKGLYGCCEAGTELACECVQHLGST